MLNKDYSGITLYNCLPSETHKWAELVIIPATLHHDRRSTSLFCFFLLLLIILILTNLKWATSYRLLACMTLFRIFRWQTGSSVESVKVKLYSASYTRRIYGNAQRKNGVKFGEFLPYKLLENFPISPSTFPISPLATANDPPVFCPFQLSSSSSLY